MQLVRYADRPDLREIRFGTLSARTFPTFMHHNQTGTRYWGRLVEEHPDFQLALLEDDVSTLCQVPGIGRKTAARMGASQKNLREAAGFPAFYCAACR